jgi:hypothetical protein
MKRENMKVLKGVIEESQAYYRQIEAEILKRLAALPKGSVKKRKLNNQAYYYLQARQGRRVVHKYLGKHKPEEIIKQLKARKQLAAELKKVRHSLKNVKKLSK